MTESENYYSEAEVPEETDTTQDRRLSTAVRDRGRKACHTGTDDRAQKRGLQKIGT